MDVVVKELACPVCSEYMLPPIKMCSTGHNICSKCKEKQSCCTVCKAYFVNTRNFSLENIASKVKLPCKYNDAGCALSFDRVQLLEHQANCKYSAHKCPFNIVDECTWEGTVANIRAHVQASHTDNVVSVTDTYNVKLNMRQSFMWYQALLKNDDVFFEYTETGKDNSFCTMIMHVGDSSRAGNFKCNLAFEAVGGSDKFEFSRGTPSYRRGPEDVIKKKKDCVVLPHSFIQKCMTNQTLCYRVSILDV